MNRKTFYIPYNGDETKVDVEDLNGVRTFLVYVNGEDGHLVITVKTDTSGNEHWYEGSEPTPRAKEIGELIELETM